MVMSESSESRRCPSKLVKNAAVGAPKCGVATATTVRTRAASGSTSTSHTSDVPGVTAMRASSPPVLCPMR